MIKIVCVGKIKEKYLKDATSDYFKRITRFSKIEIIECNEYSEMDVKSILEREKQQIEKNIGVRDCVVTLEIDGENLTSEELSQKIENIYMNYGDITFVIGGSYGLHEDIKKRSNYALSFSKMTFPHQLFRVILLEQIYRAFKIQNNEKYNK